MSHQNPTALNSFALQRSVRNLLLGVVIATSGTMMLSAAAAEPPAKSAAPATLSAAQIVERNVAARGGLTAWHAVQAMSWSGKMEVGNADSTERSARFARAGSAPTNHEDLVKQSAATPGAAVTGKQVELPFTLTMQRPHRTRFDLVFAGKTAEQVYDGTQGWKVRPFLNRNDAEPFSADELKAEQARESLEGPLVDYAAKGTRIDLDGLDKVDGRSAYKLKLTLKSGTVQHVWIDAQSFLDVKIEGTPRRMDERMHPVYVSQRDFRNVQGLMVPFVMETAVSGYSDTHKILVEKVTVNPKLAADFFAKPMAAAAAKPVMQQVPAGRKPNSGA